ncbi:HAD family hydrolase [Halobacteriales archaeon QH_2_65_14]|nr:MAG: HAD family hydrolase [Halobacteriales archaeon QH_2_65_14]
MERYDQLFRLYEEFDTDTLQSYQEFVDLSPPVDSRVALDHWQNASEELEARKDEIRSAFPQVGETFASVAALATRDQAFAALDLYSKDDRGVNVLVLDVDETLRSAGNTDNEIPRETLHLLTRFHGEGIPIVICTGQTLENVKGFLIQGLGNSMVHSGNVSIVYEAGTGVFTPGQGEATKQLLYENLDPDVQTVFSQVRGRVDLLEECVADVVDGTHEGNGFARQYYAQQDPEIRGVLETTGDAPETSPGDVPEPFREFFERIDVAYYEADAAEVGSLELNKVVGVEAALDVLGVDDPFALIMGDSKSDLRVMEWADEHGAGIAAAPEHASEDVLDHVTSTDDLVFDRGDAAEMLRTAYVLRRLAALD